MVDTLDQHKPLSVLLYNEVVQMMCNEDTIKSLQFYIENIVTPIEQFLNDPTQFKQAGHQDYSNWDQKVDAQLVTKLKTKNQKGHAKLQSYLGKNLNKSFKNIAKKIDMSWKAAIQLNKIQQIHQISGHVLELFHKLPSSFLKHLWNSFKNAKIISFMVSLVLYFRAYLAPPTNEVNYIKLFLTMWV